MTTTFATEQELLDYCESVELEIALANTLALDYLLKQREFPALVDDDYDYV